MCTRCRTIRHASPPELLAHYDPGEPWLKWGCPIQGCGHRGSFRASLRGHTAAEHPGWVATYELLRPYPNQLERVVYRQVEAPPSDPSTL
jgi:hypothetical protein